MDPLPVGGLLCVEASAGTGKTHQLSTLATRWLVERDDVRVADLLIVTYTVAAAGELRGRVRERLAEVRDQLGSVNDTRDEYISWLASSPDAPLIRERAVRALAEFDTATICTIHAFAASALGDTHGAIAPVEKRRRQAVTDVLSVTAFDPGAAVWDGGSVTEDALDEIVRLRLDHPDLAFAPLDGAVAQPSAFGFRDTAQRAVDLFIERQHRDGVLTYADLLTELDSVLHAEGSTVLQMLRSRFRVGLIDEFQDTDATQWRIFSKLFLEDSAHTLVVVGDPKQAIYGFRGADVDTYLSAKDVASGAAGGRGLGVRELGTNYRSDGALLGALNGLFDGAHFDEAGRISYSRVTAAPQAASRRLVDAAGIAAVPLSIRVPVDGGRMVAQRASIAEECAEEAVRALSCAIVGDDGVATALSENDIAVLCARRFEFAVLKEAFLRRGIRTTEAKSDDVLLSNASLHVGVVLRAMADPADSGAVAALGHSMFGAGGTDEDATALARERIGAWGRALESRGVAALARAMTSPTCTTGLLARPSGERLLTDVHHLFDLLADAVPPDAGPSVLLEALQAMGEAEWEASDEATRARRIDTDAPAVRLMTVHGSKGLEFGVVLCPFIQQTGSDDRRAVIWRDEGLAGRLVDAGGATTWTDQRLGAPNAADRVRLATYAAGGESRRLHYVALTRAKHRCVVWWLPAHGTTARRRDELTALLMDRNAAHQPVQRPRVERSAEGAECYDLSGRDALHAVRGHLGHLVAEGLVEVTEVASRERGVEPSRVEAGHGLVGATRLDVAVLRRSLEGRDRRCSFSSLVAGGHARTVVLDATVGDAGAGDEGPELGVEPADDGDPFEGLRGTAFGSAVHEALEAGLSRPRASSFDEATTSALRTSMRQRSITGVVGVAGGLLAAASVPIADGPALRDLDLADVSTEMRFALPVAEGVDLPAIARTIADHDAAGPFENWAGALAERPAPRPLAASLVGSIDLVSSLGTAETFWVLDYKTNVCDPAGGGYGATGLHAAMCEADYPLQAMLYLVALHRFLRWRIADYDPARHLGGAHYLFLRGMRPGSDLGVCSWTPSHRAVTALSDLLAGVTGAAS